MKATVCVPFYNQLNDSKGMVSQLVYSMYPKTELMVIDNGSTDPIEEFFLKYLKPKRLNYIRNEQNIGMIRTMQQAYENCTTEILIVAHNDVFMYADGWDEKVLKYFENIPMLGVLGLFGSQGCGQAGERLQDVPAHMVGSICAGKSNMLEAEVHGLRLKEDFQAVSILDGFFMAFNMDMLKETGGFDQRYQFHHYYDRDICLESLKHGYKNVVVNLPSHHLSGLTANRGDYQDWVTKQAAHMRSPGDERSGDKYAHDSNAELFYAKWKDVTPLYVENDFSFRKGGSFDFKGDIIQKL